MSDPSQLELLPNQHPLSRAESTRVAREAARRTVLTRSDGIPVSIIGHVDRDKVRDMVIAGVPQRQIADHFGIDHELIRKWAWRYKWPTPNKVAKRMAELVIENTPLIQAKRVVLDKDGIVTDERGVVVTGKGLGGSHSIKTGKSGGNDGESVPALGGDGTKDALTVIAEEARKVGVSALSGFVHRAAPVFNSFTPNVPETIGEASILMKMISKAAGLDNQASNNSTNVQVNIACGPWGRKVEDNSFQDADDIDG